jgi:ribosomal-protein-alanine N-acetyltransferase
MAPVQERFQLVPMGPGDVDAVWEMEKQVFPYPWSRANFADSIASGYDAWLLRGGDDDLAGYFVVMYALDEAHLLDVAVALARQRAGLGRYLLDQIVERARAQGMESILLEVRPSNGRALQVYEKYGFSEIGRRKGYYPALEGQREDAIVMRFVL